MAFNRYWLIVVVALLPLNMFAERDPYDKDFTGKIGKVIHEVQQIKVGMTRAQLLKVFTTEGGLSTRLRRRFVYPSCPDIKVDVEFEPVEDVKTPSQENAADKITKISQPFLELSIID